MKKLTGKTKQETVIDDMREIDMEAIDDMEVIDDMEFIEDEDEQII